MVDLKEDKKHQGRQDVRYASDKRTCGIKAADLSVTTTPLSPSESRSGQSVVPTLASASFSKGPPSLQRVMTVTLENIHRDWYTHSHALQGKTMSHIHSFYNNVSQSEARGQPESKSPGVLIENIDCCIDISREWGSGIHIFKVALLGSLMLSQVWKPFFHYLPPLEPFLLSFSPSLCFMNPFFLSSLLSSLRPTIHYNLHRRHYVKC